MFQFESPGMRDVLRRYQPTRIEDLTALNALYRPGPDEGRACSTISSSASTGRKAVTYDLPELRAILEETYGVILYQEQVMQISSRLAGYSLGEADILRRAMGKKKAEEMAAQRERFMKGAFERGFPQRKIEKIFDLMEQFAGYGFNKSHSAAYALLAFVTAYLQSALPGGFYGRAADVGNREPGQDREVHQRVPRHVHHGAAAGRELERLELYAGGRGHPLRLGRGEEPGAIGGGRRSARRASRWGASARSISSARPSTWRPSTGE